MPATEHDHEQPPMEDLKRAEENTITPPRGGAGTVNDEETASTSDIDAEAGGEEPDLATIDRVYSYVSALPFLN